MSANLYRSAWAIESRKPGGRWERHIPPYKFPETAERRIREFLARGAKREYRVRNEYTDEIRKEAPGE